MKILYENKIIKNILGLGIYRVLGLATNFLLVGLIYRYLSSEEINGVWLTVSSILTWLSFFDFGMGNGLRNKLTESITKKDYELSKMYISTTYVLMIIPTILIILVSVLIVPHIDWAELFSITSKSITNEYLSVFTCVLFVLFAINFYLSILFAILHATFQSYKISMIQFIVNLLNIVVISLLNYFTKIDDLIILGMVYIGSSILVLLVTTIWIFLFEKKNIRPSFKKFHKPLISDILGIGIKFLVLQLAIIILFNSDNFIISKYIGVEEVTSYQLVYKILSLFTIVLGIILTPTWTLITQYSANKEFKKVKDIFFKLLVIYSVLFIGVILAGVLSPKIIDLWIGDKIIINKSLIFFMIIFTAVHMWSNIFQNILNGLNLLNVQVITFGIATIINIPISIWLVINTHLGVSGIITGTIISLCVPAIILPIYTFKYFLKNIN
ncbi:hypothetical protein CN330_10225 [Priestia megaterium]|uniref:lipopolysaccharide biosynthesis protein n=1 Tax=Priestia megaterium TaxID=1404 RepID=UPI000BF8F3F4|nr:MATE family efflux transporter [Priestia megaterium]PEZ12506.1 hypothetical protein CN330_10225 [Priestia megaterium]